LGTFLVAIRRIRGFYEAASTQNRAIVTLHTFSQTVLLEFYGGVCLFLELHKLDLHLEEVVFLWGLEINRLTLLAQLVAFFLYNVDF